MNKILILLFLSISACLNAQVSVTSFPEKIKTKKSAEHIRVKGTKLFIKVPSDYIPIKELSRFYKADDLYIQFMEMNQASFTQVKGNYRREYFEAKGVKIDILQDVKLNQMDAVFSEGPSKKIGETKAMFVFGDDETLVMVVGVYPQQSKEGKEEILNIFKSIFYDKTYELDPLELAHFEFDQSITGLKYAMTASNMFVFNESGKADDSDFITSINFASLPKMTKEKGSALFLQVLNNFQHSAHYLKSTDIKQTQIGAYSAILLESDLTYKGKKGIFYGALLQGESSGVMFMGSSYKDLDKWLAKYKETVKTVKLK